MATPTPPTPPTGSPAVVVPPPKAAAALPKPPPRPIPAGLRPLLYLGIPRGVLTYRPKPPSRNTSIFLVVTTSLVSLWYYDRRECKRLKQEYIDQVKHLAAEPLAPYEYPRKVQVYGARSPGDEDYDKSIIYFKRYVKPILVAAGIDFEILNGRRHGGLGRELQQRIYARRRQLLGLEPWGCEVSTAGSGPVLPTSPDAVAAQTAAMQAFALSPQQQLQRELDGAVVVLGRPAYKEYMWSLREGWSRELPPQRQDLDEPLANRLSDDGRFDEVPEEGASRMDTEVKAAPSTSGSTSASSSDLRPDEELDEIERRNRALEASADADEGAPLPASSRGPMPNLMSSSASGPSSSRGSFKPAAPKVDPTLLAPPQQIPAQPPLLFVDYVNLAGWRQIPKRMVGFFYHRERMRQGGEYGLQIALCDKSTAREFDAPVDHALGRVRDEPPQGGDLDWGLQGEGVYPPRFHKILKRVEDEKESYYKELPRRLRDTRTLVRGQREPSRVEKNDPPKTEGELREERFKREKDWQSDEMGYAMLRTDEGVAWSEAFRGALRVLRRQREDKEAGLQGTVA